MTKKEIKTKSQRFCVAMSCAQLGKQMSLIFVESSKQHRLFDSELEKLNRQMLVCARAIADSDRSKAFLELRRATTATQKLKDISKRIVKLKELYFAAIDVNRALPDQPDEDGMF